MDIITYALAVKKTKQMIEEVVGSSIEEIQTLKDLAQYIEENGLTNIPEIAQAVQELMSYDLDKFPEVYDDVNLLKQNSVGEKTQFNGEIFNNYIQNMAQGEYSHAEGDNTAALAKGAHSEGISTKAGGDGAHAEGINTIVNFNSQHVQGQYNIIDNNNEYAHIIGNGEYNEETGQEVRSNAHTVDWKGNGWYAGKLTISTEPTNEKDVATKGYIDTIFDALNQRLLALEGLNLFTVQSKGE